MHIVAAEPGTRTTKALLTREGLAKAQDLAGSVGSSPWSFHLFGEVGHAKQQRPSAYPSHVTDAEYSVDDVLINVCRDKLHLDGSVAPRCLLGPVLHTQLRQGKRA